MYKIKRFKRLLSALRLAYYFALALAVFGLLWANPLAAETILPHQLVAGLLVISLFICRGCIWLGQQLLHMHYVTHKHQDAFMQSTMALCEQADDQAVLSMLHLCTHDVQLRIASALKRAKKESLLRILSAEITFNNNWLTNNPTPNGIDSDPTDEANWLKTTVRLETLKHLRTVLET